ncbi:MAG: PAS domain-containing protein [Deltaproteobacteria bacterium]|nr:PAS domain-containing protein [Deltaproteobacteria bacterium]
MGDNQENTPRALTTEDLLKKQAHELKRLALIAARTHNVIVITDLKGQIEWVNEGFIRLTGYSESEVIGKRPSEFLHGEDTSLEVRREMSQALKRKEAFDAEIVNYSKTGWRYWIKLEA